jgi:hypothetical protein
MYYSGNGEVDQGKLFQGDIFEPIPCPYLQGVSPLILREQGEELVPAYEQDLPDAWQRDELILVRARKLKVILLSQTCDIHEEERPNLYLGPEEKYVYQFILFAPLIPITQLDEYPKLRRNVEKLRQQNLPGAFWLPGDDQKGIEESVVYFHLVAAMLKRRDNRFRSFDPRRRLASLRSPYREALATKFAHLIGRVALPSDFVFADNQPAKITS